MGRNKISIKKLEPASQRTNTFSKRSKGIKKKAKELSIISDAQVLLLLRTTTGEYDLFHDENSSFDGVVQKFLNETQKNLEYSRSDSMDFLRKKFKSDNHTLNAISLMDHGTRPTDDKQQGSDLEMHLKNLKLEVSNLESKLGSLRNIAKIEKLEKFEELTRMENSILKLLSMNDQQSRVPPSLAQNNPPMPLILPNYAGSVVNTGFDQHFHDMLQPANLPTNCMNTPAPPSPIFTGPHPNNDWSHTMRESENNWARGAANLGQVQQYYPAMANDYEAGSSRL